MKIAIIGAYRALKPSVLPQVKDAAWVRNAIDAYVLAGPRSQGADAECACG